MSPEYPVFYFCRCLHFLFALCVFVQSQISADTFTRIRRMSEDTDKKQKAKSRGKGEKTLSFSYL